jgi:hypothetical protein
MSDRIGRAAVHLHVHDELLDLVAAGRFIQINKPATKHSHTDPHYLSRAKVSVSSG